MRVVDSTITAAAILREIRGNSQYWLEVIERDGIEAYHEHRNEEVVVQLQTYVNDCNRALVELNEPADAIPSTPLSAS